MTTISNNLSTLLAQSLANTGTATSSPVGSSLLAAVEQELSGSGSSNGSIADLVSLGGSAQANQPTTYNAQGLLSQVQSALASNDPLLQDTGATGSSALDSLLGGSTGSSSLDSLFGSSTGTGSSSLNSGMLLQTLLAGQTAGTGSSSSNAALSQAFSQNPSLASDLAQAAVSQSIFSALP